MLTSDGIAHKINRIFYSSISSMSGTALLIIAGSRFSYAIVASGSLFWVSIITAFIGTGHHGISSKSKIRMLNVLLSSFAGSIYFFLLYLLNPMLALETSLICALSPVFYMRGKFCRSLEHQPADEIFQEAWIEPLTIAGLILAFSLIREPLGFATLSIPGGKRGIIELFNTKGSYPYPIQLISSSVGALFLLAYILVILRYFEKGKNLSGKTE